MFNRQKPPAAPGKPDAATVADALTDTPAPVKSDAALAKSIETRRQTVVSKDTPPTIIQSDLVLKGMILTDGAVELHGVLEGDICAKSFKLGATGQLRGDVVSEEVVIDGEGSGRITARVVKLGGGARYSGDILHQRLAIEDGAEFEGSVLRKTDEAAWAEISKTFETPGVELTEEALKAVEALKAEFSRRSGGA